MRTDDLDYDLPEELIAQEPLEPRDAARLLVDRGPGRPAQDATILDLVDLLDPGDVLVVNETRVLPARVAVRRTSGGSGEVLLLAPRPERGEWIWEALCRPSRRLRAGESVEAVAGALRIELVEDLGAGRWLVRPSVGEEPVGGDALLAALEVAGEMPLPPYITTRLRDRERYQTMFARRPASAAAPTAGLHFTQRVLAALAAKGVEVLTVELVVGLDTFRPLTTENVEDHQIHTEWYRVPQRTWDAVQATRAAGHRVVAVGTTSVRALESVAVTGELSGDTALFIHPGYRFAVVDLLLTNFHMPRTSLLALVQAFVGPRWRELYRSAVERRYRFLSFGDAMLLTRAEPVGATVEGDGP